MKSYKQQIQKSNEPEVDIEIEPNEPDENLNTRVDFIKNIVYRTNDEPEINENIDVPINVGDVVLGGKFKNKRITVKEISTNEKGDILINGKPMMKVRILQDQE